MDPPAPRVLLGGGIGSGKTAAAAQFASLGAVIVSTDEVSRSLLRPGTSETAAVARRWPEVAHPSGEIDRRRLGAIVFADAEELAELEAIIHPGVSARVDSEVGRHPDSPVVVEVPILRDLPGHGWPWIVVDAPDDLRLARAVARGPLGPHEVLQVMARQAGRGDWLAAATWVIDNGGDAGQLGAECRRVWEAMRT